MNFSNSSFDNDFLTAGLRPNQHNSVISLQGDDLQWNHELTFESLSHRAEQHRAREDNFVLGETRDLAITGEV